MTYDYSRADVSYTFYGVLVKKRGVCEGYANAFKLCASVMGISCENVIGYIGRNSSVGHEWNIVKLEDGKWYHIDVTFNDTGTKNKYCGTTYKYFCLTDEQMKAADHRWYDRKKCNGKKYTVANYEKKYFIDSEKGLYDAVKQAVKEKKEFVHFFILTSKIDNYPSFPEINSEYASIYVGRNVNIQRIDTCRHSIPDYLAPNKKSYIMFLYQITYPSNNKVTQWQYVDNNQDMEQMLKDAVAQGQTSIKVVLVSSDVLLDGFCAPEISYKLLGKYVTIVIPCEEDIPTFLTKGKGQYTRYEIVIDYSEANSSVYNVTTDTEIRGAFENAIAKKETKIYLYSPNHSEDQIRDISIDYSCYSEEVKNIHISRSSYNYMDPYTGKVMTPFWTEVEITYR